ncbi:protein kinase domain-containing protein [Thiolapillus sp.]
MDADSADIHIPGYKILSLIGEGANATVYLALQESLNRHVALKILQRFDRPAQAVRFFNEGQIVASMNHPNIITIYDIGSVGSQQYIAMEYLEGGSLRDRAKDKIPPAAALEIIQSIGSALEFVHQMGIVHRDIKPENILFHKSSIPKITDFGVAKALDRDMNLTMDGTALGSPYYLSPEQAEGKDLDGRSDIYSLGVILFELLAQRKPYLGESQIEVIFGHLNKPVPALPERHHHYQALVEKMMAKDADERFSSAREMLDHLNMLRNLGEHGSGRRAADLNPGGKPAGRENTKGLLPSLRSRPLLAASIGITLFLGAAAALMITEPSSQPVTVEAAKSPPPEVAATQHAAIRAAATPPQADFAESAAEPAGSTFPEEAFSPVKDPGATTPVTAEDNTPSTIDPVDNDTTEDVAQDGETDIESAIAALGEPAPSKEERIESLLQKAEVALQKYRLTSPRTDSAYYYYSEILKLDPGNKQAYTGISKLAGKYALLADKALKKEDEKKARSYIERGLRIRPKDALLQAKLAHLDALEAARLAPPPAPEPVAQPEPKPKPEPPVNTSLQLLESLE